MPSSYSDLLRLLKQATGENSLTWGDLVNSGFLELVEDSVAGTATIDLTAGTGGYTLSANNGSSDEARCAILKFTGSPTVDKNITVPTTSKVYVVYSNISTSKTLTITTGSGTTVSIVKDQLDIVIVTSSGVKSLIPTDTMKKTNNLSDVASVSSARTNLGLKSAALLDASTDGTFAGNSDTLIPTQKAVKTYADTNFASAAQGALADTALQPSDDIPAIRSSSYTALSGTSTTISGIPTGVKKVTIGFVSVSSSGADNFRVQLGTSSGLQTSGYAGAWATNTTGSSAANLSSGIDLVLNSSAVVGSGVITLLLIDASTHTWVFSGTMGLHNNARGSYVSGAKQLSGSLDRVAFVGTGGSAWGSGAATVTWEF